MSGTPTIRSSVFAPIIGELETKGINTDLLLADHGLVREHLDDPYSTVSLSRYLAFFEKAADVCNSPNLGALIGTRITPGDLGPTGLLFSASATIFDGLNRLSRFISALQGDTHCALQEIDGDAVWSYQIGSSQFWPRQQDAEFTLSVCCQLIRLSFSRSWTPTEVHFEHSTSNTAALNRLFRSPIKFGQSSNRIVIGHSDAMRVRRTEDTTLRIILEHHLQELARESIEIQTFSAKVRALVALNIGQTNISVINLSRDLGVAPRTLQRRLRAEGSSLRSIIEDYRREVTAKQVGTNVSQRHIAEMLGYSDATAFWRARKRWKSVRDITAD